MRKPAHCTAEGQAILAFQPPEVIDRVIADGLVAHTPKTITGPERFLKALAAVRQRGCAIEDEESEIGMVLRRGADPRRRRRGGGGGRHRRAGDAAVEEGGGGRHAARDRDGGSGLGAARLSGAGGGVIS